MATGGNRSAAATFSPGIAQLLIHPYGRYVNRFNFIIVKSGDGLPPTIIGGLQEQGRAAADSIKAIAG
jgi:hypothetical protein